MCSSIIIFLFLYDCYMLCGNNKIVNLDWEKFLIRKCKTNIVFGLKYRYAIQMCTMILYEQQYYLS